VNLGFKTTNWHDIANRAKADAEVEMIIECGWGRDRRRTARLKTLEERAEQLRAALRK
jgi:hypothetical protein